MGRRMTGLSQDVPQPALVNAFVVANPQFSLLPSNLGTVSVVLGHPTATKRWFSTTPSIIKDTPSIIKKWDYY